MTHRTGDAPARGIAWRRDGVRDRLTEAAPVVLVALGVVVLLLLVSGAYGFHRDELYFILAGQHPALGYVDQPPLTPLLSAWAVSLLGLTPTAVRILPAIGIGVSIVLVGLTAREFGGSRRAMALAAVCISCTAFLGAGHLDETTTFDLVAWTTILWLVAGLLRGADPRRWLAVGIVAGIGLENKDLILFLGAALVVGLLVARRWDVFRSPWPWAAVGLAVLIWLPNLAWQASNGWPQITMAGRISGGSGMENRVELLPFQLLLGGAFLAPVLVAGLLWFARSEEGRPWRAFAWAYVVLLVLLFASGGKGYYAAGFFGPLIAAGAVRLDGWLDRGRSGLRWTAFGLAAVASGLLVIVVMLPVIPAASLGSTFVPTLYKESAEQIGWQQLAGTVEGVVASLPLVDRRNAVIVTANYGEAGALSLLGHDLPPVYSGHNSLAALGPPPERPGPVLLVGYWGRASWAPYFGGCTEAAVFDNGLRLDNEEQGSGVLVCTTRSMPWAQSWPSLTHIN